MPLFESYDRRIKQINKFLNDNGISSIEEAKKICDDKGVDVYNIVKGIQPIAFENAMWAYIVGAAVAIKRGQTVAADIASTLGEGLQSFCIPGSLPTTASRLGHGNLAAMLLKEETKCFAFLAGHESFAAAEGLSVLPNRLTCSQRTSSCYPERFGEDAAKIIARINGFTYVETDFDYFTGELKEVQRIAYSRRPCQSKLLRC
jgi:hypothetical protein